MPLIKAGSKEAVSKNIKTERKAGKPSDVALAIALSVADKYKKSNVKLGKGRKMKCSCGKAGCKECKK